MVATKKEMDKVREAADPKNHTKLMEKRYKELKAHSKPLEALIVTLNFTIDDVVSETEEVSFAPQSEIVYGPRSSPMYRGGYNSKLILKVTPRESGIPTQTLNFYGFSIVKAGDYVSAKIPAFKKEEMNIGHEGRVEINTFYLERELTAEEDAIELAIIDVNGKVLRRDRAVDYKQVVKK